MFRAFHQFHKKDAGDEWIFILRPDDQSEEAFQKLLRDVHLKFKSEIDKQILKWKSELRDKIAGKVQREFVDLMVDKFSLHASQVVVNDLRITVGNGQFEKGDFKSPMYSILKGVEKHSTTWAIAMYEEQARWISDVGEKFEPLESKIHQELSEFVNKGIISSEKLPRIGLLVDIERKKALCA